MTPDFVPFPNSLPIARSDGGLGCAATVGATSSGVGGATPACSSGLIMGATSVAVAGAVVGAALGATLGISRTCHSLLTRNARCPVLGLVAVSLGGTHLLSTRNNFSPVLGLVALS